MLKSSRKKDKGYSKFWDTVSLQLIPELGTDFIYSKQS